MLGLLLAAWWFLINLAMGSVEEQPVSFAIVGLVSGAIGWVISGFMSS